MLIAGTLLYNSPVAVAGGGGGGTGTGTPTTSQMRSWLFNSKLVNFASGIASATTQNSGNTTEASAAAFDTNNNLLFYVTRNFNTLGTVYSPTNTVVGQLTGITKPNRSYDESDWGGCGREIAVVPVPGTSYRYYLFYTLATNYLSNIVAYAVIDCSCGTPVIVQNSQRVDNTAEYVGSTAPGLAATKQLADGTRKLYVAGGSSAISYTLLANGTISSRSVLTGSGNVGGGNSEVELSPDGNYLAWAASNNTVYLTNLGNPIANPILTNSNPINGLEFSAGSDKLFIAGSALSVYTLSNSTTTTIAASGSNPLAANTQLELAYDGLIYGASNSGAPYTINPSTLAVATSPLGFSLMLTSGLGTAGPAVYTFPDQQDGEDYTSTYFASSAPVISKGLRVDGALLKQPATSQPVPPATPVYTCNPLTLSLFAPSSTNVIGYDVIINRTDADGNVLANGYSATFTNVGLPKDLGTLTGGYLTNAANASYYQVKVVGYDACQPRRTSEAIGRMQLSTLTAGSANFYFNLCNGTGPLASATSPTAPAELGKYGGGGIDISPSSGDYDSYQVQFAQYVAGSNPAQFTPIGSLSDVLKPTGTGLNTIGLTYLAAQSGLEAPYFQDGHPGFNVVHRLTLTVRNPCGTSPQVVGYFITSNIACRSAAGPEPMTDKSPIFPNPIIGSDMAHLRFTLPTAQPVSMELTDALTGQVRLTVLRGTPRKAGE